MISFHGERGANKTGKHFFEISIALTKARQERKNKERETQKANCSQQRASLACESFPEFERKSTEGRWFLPRRDRHKRLTNVALLSVLHLGLSSSILEPFST